MKTTPTRKIILIGGAPTVGKSYVAKNLAKSLEIPYISTDIIRGQMKALVRESDYPELFQFRRPTTKKIEAYLKSHTPKQIIEDQNLESTDVWKGILALVQTNEGWEPLSFVIEGVAILPNLASKLVKQDKSVKVIFIIDDDRERIRNVIFKRGLFDFANKYSDSVKEKEVEWVVLFNEYIKKEAKKYGFPLLNAHDKDFSRKIKKLVGK